MEDKYIITIGDFIDGDMTYHNRCLCAAIGGEGIISDIIPWKDSGFNPWDYKYQNGEFVLDVINLIQMTPSKVEQLVSLESQIEAMIEQYKILKEEI